MLQFTALPGACRSVLLSVVAVAVRHCRCRWGCIDLASTLVRDLLAKHRHYTCSTGAVQWQNSRGTCDYMARLHCMYHVALEVIDSINTQQHWSLVIGPCDRVALLIIVIIAVHMPLVWHSPRLTNASLTSAAITSSS